ncbi:MAG: adenylate/guanylate cyclase domain-containing protein [Cyanobacteria bacterium P01_D01_bin.115]
MVQSVPTTLSDEQQLEALLRQRRQDSRRAHEIDADIRDRFLATQAIVVLDMVGFSHQTQEQGIIPALQQIYVLQETAIPILTAHQGRVFKQDADNLYAAFATPDAALEATEHLLTELNAIDIHASIGIGYGEVLVVGDHNLYGNEINLASKLGEDIAGDDEILLTAAAHDALTTTGWQFVRTVQTISHVTPTVYQLQRHG